MIRDDPAVRALLGRNDLTVDDVETLPDEVHCELWDGRLVLLPSELPIHQIMRGSLVDGLDTNCPEHFCAIHSMPIELDRHNELRPDAVVVAVEGAWRGPVLPGDVLLVGEVISPWSEQSDRGAKMDRYASAGIPAYWIIDPLGEHTTLSAFRLGSEGRYQRLFTTDGLVTVDQPWAVTLDLPAWTRQRDYLRAVARRRG